MHKFVSRYLPLLAVHFLEMFADEMRVGRGEACLAPTFSESSLEVLMSYHFPGNVRELKDIIEHALIRSRGEAIEAEHLHFIDSTVNEMSAQRPAGTESRMPAIISEGRGYSEAVEHFQRQLVSQTLAECNGNRHKAARRMKMDRGNLRRLMKRLGVT